MAKAIRLGKPHGNPGRLVNYDSVPPITPQVCAAYTAAHPDRSICFSDSDPIQTTRVGTAAPNEFRHELYHDAESAYWLLLRWALLAYPAGTLPTEIPSALWTSLTDTTCDIRPHHIPEGSLNPGYGPSGNPQVENFQ